MVKQSDRLQEQLEAIRREIRSLREELLREKEQAVLGALTRRGFRCFRREEEGGLILPSARRPRERFYHLLKKYSFRLFLRDVIRHKVSFSIRDLLRYCSEETAENYLHLLLREKLVRRTPGRGYRLVDERIVSFGDTLEWLVYQVLTKEFHLAAAWGFRVEDNLGGGDFDVVAVMEGSLVYVETKSSPPKHIHQHEIGAFFDRLATLRPDLAIFLNDTQLRMKDKIAVMFERELRRRHGASWRKKYPLQRLERELFGIGDRLFIVNSDPDLVLNIGYCLRRYLQCRGIDLSR